MRLLLCEPGARTDHAVSIMELLCVVVVGCGGLLSLIDKKIQGQLREKQAKVERER